MAPPDTRISRQSQRSRCGAQKVGTERPQHLCHGVRGPARCSARFCSRTHLGSTELIPQGPLHVAVHTTRSKALRSAAEALRSNVLDGRTRFLCDALVPPTLEVTTWYCLCPYSSGSRAVPPSTPACLWSGQVLAGRALPSLLAPVVLCMWPTPGQMLLGVWWLVAGRGERLGRPLELDRGRGLAWPLPPARTLVGK